ncbi:MAG: agmatine deiminase family protein [Gammaproteobacteria bacterium]
MIPPLLLPEYAPQSGVMLTWPHEATDWRAILHQAEALYIELVRAISRHETVLIICHDETLRAHVQTLLEQADIPQGTIRYCLASANDTWVRDYGPLTVQVNGSPLLLDFAFDGWGGKYPSTLDNEISHTLYAAGVFGRNDYLRHTLVLEGGSVDTDGSGTLLTTARCLLNSARNPGLDRHQLEGLLSGYLGISRFLWLDHGELEGDDTDGHVDMLARFCSPDIIAYSRCDNPNERHYPELNAMEQQLRTFRKADGTAYHLVPLPLPPPVLNASGQQLPASYANFLIINAAVLVPVYADPADATALEALAPCFPDRELIPVDCTTLIEQSGSLHCATMQLPAGVLPENGAMQ